MRWWSHCLTSQLSEAIPTLSSTLHLHSAQYSTSNIQGTAYQPPHQYHQYVIKRQGYRMCLVIALCYVNKHMQNCRHVHVCKVMRGRMLSRCSYDPQEPCVGAVLDSEPAGPGVLPTTDETVHTKYAAAAAKLWSRAACRGTYRCSLRQLNNTEIEICAGTMCPRGERTRTTTNIMCVTRSRRTAATSCCEKPVPNEKSSSVPRMLP